MPITLTREEAQQVLDALEYDCDWNTRNKAAKIIWNQLALGGKNNAAKQNEEVL